MPPQSRCGGFKPLSESALATPARGQAWKRKGVGECFFIMAHADGYVMARYKRCAPFVIATKDLQRNCERMTELDRNMGRAVRFICSTEDTNVSF